MHHFDEMQHHAGLRVDDPLRVKREVFLLFELRHGGGDALLAAARGFAIAAAVALIRDDLLRAENDFIGAKNERLRDIGGSATTAAGDKNNLIAHALLDEKFVNIRHRKF